VKKWKLLMYHLEDLRVPQVGNPCFTATFFNLFAAAKPSANVCVVHGTVRNDPSVYIAATA